MKSNPLFHDSTLSQGTNIKTQFEISDVPIKDGQILCLKLIVGDDLRFIEMKKMPDQHFKVAVWIEHRKRISYQFFIQHDGELISATPLKQSLALHTVLEKWEELEGDDWKKNLTYNPSEVEKLDLDFIENDEKEVGSETYF